LGSHENALENKVSLKPLELGYGQKLIIPSTHLLGTLGIRVWPKTNNVFPPPLGTLGIREWPKANNLFTPSWNPRNLGNGQKLITSSPPLGTLGI
jgi:hypothetical protein